VSSKNLAVTVSVPDRCVAAEGRWGTGHPPRSGGWTSPSTAVGIGAGCGRWVLHVAL